MKKLKVRSISAKPDRLVYIPPSFTPYNPFGCYYVEYLGQQMPIQVEYDPMDKGEVCIPEYIAKKLGVKLGDKIAIGVSLFEKKDTDYMSLYEKDPKNFIKFFNKRKLGEKKKILKELLEHDIVNEKVVRWLDEHEPNLVREVCFKDFYDPGRI